MKILFLLLVAIVVCIFLVLRYLQAPVKWSPGNVVRTPEDRFSDLPDYPFEPNYLQVLGYRVHYLDQGVNDADVILLLHGQPSWSYLYRHMIPPLVAAGYRVIAPDLVGFGKSDKPTRQSDYSYQMHIDVIAELVRQLDVRDISLFAQDWGGLIGLRVVALLPDRFSRVMISNTALPAAGGIKGWLGYPIFRYKVWRRSSSVAVPGTSGQFDFLGWVNYALHSKDFDVENLFQSTTTRKLESAELWGYSAPFPSEKYLQGARVFPYLITSQLRQNQRVLEEVYANWKKPFLTAFSDSDPVTAGGETMWQALVPGAMGQAHASIEDGHHFVQEDKPAELVEILLQFISGKRQLKEG